MKHSEAHSKMLSSYAKDIGIDLSAIQTEKLLTYLDLLLAKNQETNLTRITNYEEAIRLHILDSLSPLPYLNLSSEDTFADIGTGGGLPGIPLAILTGAQGTLVDSVKKKAQAVEVFVRTLDLGNRVTVYAGRVEELAVTEAAGSFNLVIARALSSLPSLLELSAPLLMNNGVLASMKGSPSKDELESAEQVVDMLGYELISVDILELPMGEENRVLYRYRKTGDSSVPLPRRVGKAQKTPLA